MNESVNNLVNNILENARIANTPIEAILAEPSIRKNMPPNVAWGTRSYKNYSEEPRGHDPNCSTQIGTKNSQRLYCSCGLYIIPFVCWPFPPDSVEIDYAI